MLKHYYKAVRLDKTSHYDRKTRWEVGSTVVAEEIDPNPGRACGKGIHCSENLLDAVKYQGGPSLYFLVEPISYKGFPAILCDSNDKVRCPAVKVLRELDQKELDDIAEFKLWEANHPFNPLLLEKPNLDIDYKTLLKQWASVRASVEASVKNLVGALVGTSVWDSVRASVGDSVWDSVKASVWASVGDSVRASVWAYIGGLFPSIKKWKYAEDLGETPWQPLLDLWYAGFVPSFDGKIWRLHCGKSAEKITLETNPPTFLVWRVFT